MTPEARLRARALVHIGVACSYDVDVPEHSARCDRLADTLAPYLEALEVAREGIEIVRDCETYAGRNAAAARALARITALAPIETPRPSTSPGQPTPTGYCDYCWHSANGVCTIHAPIGPAQEPTAQSDRGPCLIHSWPYGGDGPCMTCGATPEPTQGPPEPECSLSRHCQRKEGHTGNCSPKAPL